jgi:hypothetical protein
MQGLVEVVSSVQDCEEGLIVDLEVFESLTDND